MFKFLKPDIFYIKVYINAVEIKNIRTGAILKRESEKPFSHQRLIIGDIETAQTFIASVIQDITGTKIKVLNKTIKIALQPMENIQGGLSKIEKRSFRDISDFCGAMEVSILDHRRNASDSEILESFLDPRLL